MNDQSTHHKVLIERLYQEGLNQQKFEQVVPQLVAAGAITHDGLAAEGSGPQAVIRTMSALHAAFSDMTFVIDDIVAEGDRCVVRWHMTGRHTGPFAGHPATHRQVTQCAVVIYRIQDEKIVEVWPLIDRLGLLHQMTGPAHPRPTGPRPDDSSQERER